MTRQSSQSNLAEPLHLHQAAEDNLRFIRAAMENATEFTGLSGKAYVLAGISACAATWLAAQQSTLEMWLAVWMLELALGSSICLSMSARKAAGQGKSLWHATGRKLLLAFLPAMSVGGILTLAFYLQGNLDQLPGIWLSLYGVAVMTAGVWSVRVIPVMGFCFILLGALTLLVPVSPTLMLALGFGGLHILFGFIIWRQHGG